ncbi:MAG: hypothetical protein LBH10_02150 [Burkholderiaceae bacterium]|nr:hypothetical protein [Burkholderiaceae bacterium]
MLAEVYGDDEQLDGTFFPQNMKPGREAVNPTIGTIHAVTGFVGFETLTLAGKTFFNTCHFTVGGVDDLWYASGYGVIKENAGDDSTWQYSRDILKH